MPASHRDRIMEGAVRCVQERGIAATTSRDIAAAADANLASIPYHFGSTRALLDQALQESLLRYAAHLEDLAAAVPPGQPAARLSETLQALLASLPESRPLLTSLIEVFAQALRSEEVAGHLRLHRRALLARIGELIRDALPDAAQFDDRAVETLAILLLSLINGLTLQWLFDPEHTPPAADLLKALGDVGSIFVAEHP